MTSTRDDDFAQLLPEYLRVVEAGRRFLPLLEQLLVPLVRRRWVLTISARVKSWQSVCEKLARKGIMNVLPQDTIGLRVVVPDLADVKRVKAFLRAEFDVVQESDSSRKERYNAVVRLNEQRNTLPEWSEFRSVLLEFQISTYRADVLRRFLHEVIYKEGGGIVPAFTIPRLDRATSYEALEASQKVVDDFETLIDRPDVHEKQEIHPFLLRHQWLLHPNPDKIWSEVAIGFGTEMRADFLIREANGNYLFVELENPRHSLFNSGGDISSAVTHAQQQVEDWQDWIEENLPTVQRYYPGMSSPAGLIIIGRSEHWSEKEGRKIARRNVNLRGRIRIATYDELLVNARAFLRAVQHLLK